MLTKWRKEILEAQYEDEAVSVQRLLMLDTLSPEQRQCILVDARKMVVRSREDEAAQGSLDAFLQEFGLSNNEGIALMCLAEALLRIPDPETADKLIAEKITSGNWESHLGHSRSIFVNASTWGLMLTGKLIHPNDFSEDKYWYSSIIGRLGDSIVRNAILQAMKILGNQFILGDNIEDALQNAERQKQEENTSLHPVVFSFDMLGEGARTQAQADSYFASYKTAICRLGELSQGRELKLRDGISVKLSALHPRYEFSKKTRVEKELYPKVLHLCQLACQHNIGLSIDAEEAERLDLSLDIFSALIQDKTLARWQGLGFVLQAYQKRASYVAHWLAHLSRQHQRKIMVRLVKGAYWDSEIKRAQELGLNDYPVFTRKSNTDFSYQICAQILLSEQAYIFPQFATHNAYTIALVKVLAQGKAFEFQRLQGMGNLLYEKIESGAKHAHYVRVYAPVGAHKDLLPYLMRRLLENGANSSFVNRFLDRETAVEQLVVDVRQSVESIPTYRHDKIPVPADIYLASGIPRHNACGIDLNVAPTANAFAESVANDKSLFFSETSKKSTVSSSSEKEAVTSPIDGKTLAEIRSSSNESIIKMLETAVDSQPEWEALGVRKRAELLNSIADLFEEHTHELATFIVFEAGRTLEDTISEIREAVDFCRYYASLANKIFDSQYLHGPTGEQNQLMLTGRGVFVCISPWNFPLAIFTGQIVAALVTGNSVITKPAEQTPCIANYVLQLMHKAGVPESVLQLALGGGSVGHALVSHAAVAGVAFTGSTETAHKINQQLSQRSAPIGSLIAETGGVNAMVVDSSALLEQVTDDVIRSAFSSAGQRCSALRILYVQEDIADELIAMLCGACRELIVGDPSHLSTDIGPVIDELALKKLHQYIEQMKQKADVLFEFPTDCLPSSGHYIGPHIIGLDTPEALTTEVFGPILHVVRFNGAALDNVIKSINTTGYGLTLGIHSRIQHQVDYIAKRVKVGNVYVNRNMVGAVVGVNPFGGCGWSGTGPKAGGPHYLYRYTSEKTITANLAAVGGNADLLSLGE